MGLEYRFNFPEEPDDRVHHQKLDQRETPLAAKPGLIAGEDMLQSVFETFYDFMISKVSGRLRLFCGEKASRSLQLCFRRINRVITNPPKPKPSKAPVEGSGTILAETAIASTPTPPAELMLRVRRPESAAPVEAVMT